MKEEELKSRANFLQRKYCNKKNCSEDEHGIREKTMDFFQCGFVLWNFAVHFCSSCSTATLQQRKICICETKQEHECDVCRF